MLTLTPRELRSVAEIIETLTKARITNERMGIPTTPDVFPARFPIGLVATIRWTPGARGRTNAEHSRITKAARQRDGYQLDLTTPAEPDQAITLRDPQGAKRGDLVVEIAADTKAATKAAERAILDTIRRTATVNGSTALK